MYYYRKIKTMLLLLLVCTMAKAQLTDGKVYNFVNVGNSGQSMVITSNHMATITTTDTGSYDQLWYVELSDSCYTLRNLASGRYLRSSNATSARWTLVKGDDMDDNCKFNCVSAGSGYTLRAMNDTNGHGYMHYGANNGGVVCWESSATATQWTMNVVEVSEDDLTANWEKLASIDPDAATVATYQTHLDNLFSDKSCTTPKKSLTTEDDIKADTDYKALPEGLQKMVLKVYLDSWAEDNYDDAKEEWEAEYAEKYRVQMYEPYNEPGAASKALGLNAHTNMNNPTGIFANADEALYVMVEGEIEEGSELYIASVTGHNKLGDDFREGVQLKQGLNVVPSYLDDNNYYINYVVHTFDTSKGKGYKAKAYKLSDYEDLKIHIEGGYINGYYNKVGDDLYTPDTNADWEYIEERATQTDVTVLGEYITLQFPLNDADTEGNKGMRSYLNDVVNIEDVIDEWDNVMIWERLLLGVLSEEVTKAEAKKSPYSEKEYVIEYTGDDAEFPTGYGDYYNVHGLSFGVGGNSYMYGGWDHCGYHYNTMGGVIQDLPTSAGAHWGPGHEIGHQHQSLLNMRGLTEVTNNLFANVVLWYYGETTSRYNGDNGSLTNVLTAYNTEGSDFFSNNIWAQTHMYYKLFLYYHVLGHNPKFYPTLFEMLRQDPMDIGPEQDGADCLLHFYNKCCLAAGEDLTEFFRAYGFFEVMENRYVGDYSSAVYNMTQEQIDEAIAEVKALKYEENLSVLFINDATGGTILSHKGDTLELYGETTICATSGSYATFTEDATSADYTYSVSGNTVTMEGTGGVGFAIYNEEGELIAFSDNSTFAISDECAALIASGEAELKVVNADNTESVPVDVMDTDDSEAKYAALGKLLEMVEAIVNYTDDDGIKVGYYRTTSVTDLKSAYTNAKTVYDAKTVSSYTAVYDVLYQEYVDFQSDDYARIGIVEGNAYQLVNRLYPAYSMSINSDTAMIGETTSADSDAQRWYFESSGTNGRYYLKNKSTSTYPGNVSTSAQLSANKAESTKGADGGAYAYELRDMGNGLWALVGNTGLHCDAAKNIVGWGADAHGTQWYITAVEVDDITEARYKLEDLMAKTEALMAEVGEVAVGETETLSLTESNYYCNAECKETAYGDQFTSYSVLCDGSSSTFLHTDYSSQAPSEDHYIRIDMGADNGLQYFNLNYTTRGSGNVCAPTKVAIEVSNDTSTWVTLRDITSGLPTANDASYTIEELGYGTSYRYVRMRVYGTSGAQQANGHYYFILSELGLSTITYAETLNSTYASMTAGVLLDAFKADLAAQGVLITATTSAEYETAYTTLETKYNALLTARKTVDDAALKTKKDELETWITNTTNLIASCGSVTYTAATSDTPTLQTTASGNAYYVSTNAQEDAEGSIEDLVDGDYDSHFHSEYTTDKGDTHYIQVNLGSGNETSLFSFEYATRKAETNFPKTIVISGSNDDANYTPIDTVTNLPVGNTSSNVIYTSEVITADTEYAYLRFTVTANNSGKTEAGGHPFFHMAEFDLTLLTLESYTVELGDDSGDATDSLMIAAYAENVSAQATYDMATTVNQVEEAIAKLQADYEALDLAKNSNTYVTYTIQVAGGNSNGGVTYRNKTYTDAATFKAPADLTVDAFTALTLDGYTGGVVTVADQTVTVTYQTIYTVQVVGGDGTGGVTFNNSEYIANDTINVVGNIETAQLTAKTIDGYDEGVITADHENRTITVTYKMTPLVDTAKYYTLECRAVGGHTSTRFVRDNGSVINGCSAEGSLFQFEAANEENGYYIKSYVTDKYLNHADGTVYASAEKNTVWTMAKPSHTPEARTLTVGSNLYLNNNGSDCTDGSCTNLQSNEHTQGVGSGNGCSLWTVTEAEPLDKSALATLIEETNTLIESCYTDETFNYSGSLNVTEDLMTATNEAVTAAQEKYDSKATTASEYEVVLAALQTAKDNLQTAINYAELPVQIAFDANTPVTYKVAINRSSGAYILEYDNSTTMVAVTSKVLLGAKAQAWYFMAATDGKVYIMPYHDNNTTLALSTNDFSQGNSKVKAMEVGADGYTQAWTITANADNSGWYNITCTSNGTDTWYFSNHGGVGNKMGFYNDAGDGGSLFKFEQVTIDKSEAYYALYNYYTNDVKLATGSIVGGEEVGYFSTTLAEAYNTAYNNAAAVLVSETATDDDYTSAYDALVAANDALVVNMPEEGKYYVLQCAHTGYAQNALAYADVSNNKMYWATDKTTTDATAIWTFTPSATEGKFVVSNLHTGTDVNGFIGSNPSPLTEGGADVSIEPLSVDGQVGILCNGTMMHAQSDYKAIVNWETEAGGASAWRIVEVEDMSLVNFSLTVSQYLHAGLYLNYPVTIPDGVKAYIIDGSDIDIDADGVGTLRLTKMQGIVLPAGNGYILDAPQGDYDFYYTEDEATDEVSGNMLGGSTYLTYREAVADHNYYVFGQKSGVVGLYKNGVKYTDSGAEGTTHYKVSANKVLFDFDNTTSQVSSFRFRVDRETTDIENVGVAEDMLIYDLCGRRIMEVKASGLYIINGEKRYIEVK